MKTCQRCQQRKPIDAFGSDKRREDGLYPYCRQCSRDYHKERRERCKAVTVTIITTRKTCSKCQQRKSSNEFPPSSPGTTRDGLLGWCRSCVATNRRAHYVKHPDKYKEDSEMRRAKQKKVRVERVNRRTVYRRDGGCCYLCGDPVEFKKMHLEHKIPLSKGGEHSYANCATSCSDCNLRKGVRLPEELVRG